MALPVGWVFAHELADDGEDGHGGEGQGTPVEGESGGDIDVVDGAFLGLDFFRGPVGLGFGYMIGEIGQLGESCVEGVGAGFVDGDGDFEGAVEVGDEPGGNNCQLLFGFSPHY